MLTPEQEARILIDEKLEHAGWAIQDHTAMDLWNHFGVAVREFPVKKSDGNTGFADYLLFVDRKVVGVIEAKKKGTTLSGVAEQSSGYAAGLDSEIPKIDGETLPFLYQSTGIETTFRDDRDPTPRSRQVYSFHRPEMLAKWAEEKDTLRDRLQNHPPLIEKSLWPAQIEAIHNLEQSFFENKPRALIQMATGSGKTFTAVNFVYRLIKHGKANRVLFLVDRNNLGRQAKKEFDNFETPDDGRKFVELYNVQHLQSNTLDSVSKVHITTIQRLYSMLRGDEEFDPENEDQSLFMMGNSLPGDRTKEVVYNPAIPIGYYDFIVIDECHRSIYNLWRQVLDYFDSFLIGLTATPNNLTFGFFHRNLVMEYSRQRAVADGVNVDGTVYQIRTEITEKGSKIDAGQYVGMRDKQTRAERWEQLDEDLEYEARQLDRDVVSKDQIRTVIRTFKEKLYTEIFPGRSKVPKTLVFAKDDNHAEEIVKIFREEFGEGDDFCKKITYKVSGKSPEELIQELRNEYNPRVAVTVDMIATGTDVKPLEILLFMRNVKSRGLFEQMIGRGTRIIPPTDFQSVTTDADRKTHFVIVDAVGVVDQEKFDPKTLDRKPGKSFEKLMTALAVGAYDEDDLSSLAGRLSRLDRQIDEEGRQKIKTVSKGYTIKDLTNLLLDAIDPDKLIEVADQENITTEEAQRKLYELAVRPFGGNPKLRQVLQDVKTRSEMVLDEVSMDRVIDTGYSQEDTAKARQLVGNFKAFLEENKDEITALEILFSQPFGQQALNFEQVKELAAVLEQPPNTFTTEGLWRAYHQLEKDKVRGVNAKRVLTDVVSLVRHAVELEDELAPYPEIVENRYQEWIVDQETSGKQFSEEQRWWLNKVAEHIGVNLIISAEDFNYGEFFNKGGQVKAVQLFGEKLDSILLDINKNVGN
jgi:type I restriction enzyme, R subunit